MDSTPQELLYNAIIEGDYDQVVKMLQLGVNPNYIVEGSTLLSVAVDNADEDEYVGYDIIDSLIKAGAEIIDREAFAKSISLLKSEVFQFFVNSGNRIESITSDISNYIDNGTYYNLDNLKLIFELGYQPTKDQVKVIMKYAIDSDNFAFVRDLLEYVYPRYIPAVGTKRLRV